MHAVTTHPLTIVHVVFSSRIAGAERHALDLAAAQADMGHDVHVVGPWRSALPEALVPEVRYHAMATPLLRAVRLQSLLRRLGADICHGHLGPACKAVARCDGVARLGTLHVGYKPRQHERLDGLICVNAAQVRAVRGFKGEARVIYNWAPQTRLPAEQSTRANAAGAANPGKRVRAEASVLDPRCTSPSSGAQAPQRHSAQVADLREELGLPPDRLVVITVARLHPSKGVDILIRAFVDRPAMDAALIIVGEGKCERQLRRLAAGDPRIHLLGFRSDVDALLSASDIFVSPSREEAMPLAVLEAMRAGLPIVATATQGAVELLSHARASLVPIGEAGALGAAIEAIAATVRQASTALMRISGGVPSSGSLRQRHRMRYDLTKYERHAAILQVESFYRSLLADAQVGDAEGASQNAAAHPEC
ncbi:glycosyltransferase [Roseateles sp. MS654]|uniref:glycosyltransferase n=1 Tax=Roseateles sp. MS654 TaxID=3412685 RepID=UPI003C2D4C8F